jgi:1,4-alpha-glucan branching enzyme
LNSDSHIYYGGDIGNFGSVRTEPIPFHSRAHSLNLVLPPLSTMFFKASG